MLLTAMIDKYKETNRTKDNYYILSFTMNLMKRYCIEKYSFIEPEDVNKFFFTEFITNSVVTYVYQDENSAIDNIIHSIYSFCKYCDCSYNTRLLLSFKEISIDDINIAYRLLMVKKEILRFIKSPIISIDPMVINIENYREKKGKKPLRKGNSQKEQGYYQVNDIFGRNSLVLKKVLGYNFIRVFLDEDAVRYINYGDILYLQLSKSGNARGWTIDDIKGCYMDKAKDEKISYNVNRKRELM